MANYDSNYAIAQEISARIGTSPIPFDSVYSIAFEIYNELGGEPAEFDSVYSILLGILPLVEGGIASKVIDDNSIVLDKTWSSSKINEEIQAVGGTADSEFDGKTTEDFRFVTELPQETTEGEQVVIKGENIDTLYKYVSGAWAEQTPDATVLYYDTENEALYSYVSAEQQFATISSVNTIVVGKNLNTSEALKAVKTPGTYSVLQRTSSTTKGEYTKKWTLTVEGVDYDEYERTDSIYQRIQSNYTIQKRTWSSTRATNDGWSSFSTYYAGEIKDSTTSKYYTWSSNKINSGLTSLDEKISNVKPIEEVSELPSASENKDKLFRLDNGDKDVYAAKLLSSETITTNRLPDEQQIDKAYIWIENDEPFYYKGAWKYILNDGELNGYGWLKTYPDSDEWYFVLTQDNAVNVTINTKCLESSPEDGEGVIDLEAHIVTLNLSISVFNWEEAEQLYLYSYYPIPATYNATESAQIGNAYLYNGDKYYYNGVEYTLNYTDGVSIKAYGWVYDGDEYPTIYTPKKASEIYYTTKGSNKITDAIGYIIDYEKYPVVSGVVTLDYPFSEQSNAMSDFQIMYIPQLNAPDSEQVGKASVYANEEIVTPCFYTGREVTLIATNGTFSCYLWEDTVNDAYVFTKVNAENAYMGAKIKYSSESYFSEIGDDTFETRSNVEEVSFNTYNSRLSTVKYKRTEVTEVWDWQPLTDNATNDDIDAMFDTPVVKRVLMKAPREGYELSVKEGLVNVSGETIVYEGQTYYQWIKYEEQDNGESIPDEVSAPDYDGRIYVLTTSLNVTLPFSSSSPEWAYLVADVSEDEVAECYASPNSETYPQEALYHEDGSITYEE